jgi:hypothetical protein
VVYLGNRGVFDVSSDLKTPSNPPVTESAPAAGADAAEIARASATLIGQPRRRRSLWVERVQPMRPDELGDFESRTFAAGDPASLGDLRRAIQQRRRELAR